MPKGSHYPNGDASDPTSRLLGIDTKGGDEHDELRTVVFDIATIRAGVGWAELVFGAGIEDEWSLDNLPAAPISGTWSADNAIEGQHHFHQADASGVGALLLFGGNTTWNPSDTFYRFGLSMPSGSTGRAGLTWAGYDPIDGLKLIDGAPFVAFEPIDDSNGHVIVGRLNESDDHVFDTIGFPTADNFSGVNIWRTGWSLGVAVTGGVGGPAVVVPMGAPSSPAAAAALLPTFYTVDQEARFGSLLHVVTPLAYALLS